jgi:hypothetical protein
MHIGSVTHLQLNSYWRVCQIERVSVLACLGHQSVRITERQYSPWVRARQEQLEQDLKRVWEQDPVALVESKGARGHGKNSSPNNFISLPKLWRRGWESNPYGLLITRNLLILREDKRENLSGQVKTGHTWSLQNRPYGPGLRLCK